MSGAQDDIQPTRPPPLGDGDFERLVGRYTDGLVRLAERHLSRSVSARESGEDVVQSVFRTFFRRCRKGEFQIDESSQFWRLLVKITVDKARAKARYHTAEKRSVRAENSAHAPGAESASREPGPAEAAILVDQMEFLVRGLPSLYRNVLEMRLQNRTVAHIATELGVSRQTVYRALHLLRDRIMSLDDTGNES